MDPFSNKLSSVLNNKHKNNSTNNLRSQKNHTSNQSTKRSKPKAIKKRRASKNSTNSARKSYNTKSKAKSHKGNASVSRSLVWNCQLNLKDVATLYAIQKSKHLHSRSDALDALIHSGLEAIIPDPKHGSQYNPMNNTVYSTFYNSFMLANKETAKKQYHKWHGTK